MNIELDPADLGVAHAAIANTITSMETVIADLAAKLPPDLFDELINGERERIAALRRISDALLDAELELR